MKNFLKMITAGFILNSIGVHTYEYWSTKEMVTLTILIVSFISFFKKEITSKFSNFNRKNGKRISVFMQLKRTIEYKEIQMTSTLSNLALRIQQITFLIGVFLMLHLAGNVYAFKLNQGIPFHKVAFIYGGLNLMILVGGYITFPRKIKAKVKFN